MPLVTLSFDQFKTSAAGQEFADVWYVKNSAGQVFKVLVWTMNVFTGGSALINYVLNPAAIEADFLAFVVLHLASPSVTPLAVEGLAL